MKIQAQFIIASIIVAITSSQGQTLQIISTEKKTSESQSAALNRISVQPLCHNFCDVPVDSMRSALFTITSTGDTPFVFRGIAIRKDCWLDSCKLDSCKLRLDSLKHILQDTLRVTYIPVTLSILAEFAPTDTVEYCASIAIKSNATDGDSIFTYIGRGVAAVPKFSTTFYDFGEVLTGDTVRWNFNIKNNGRYVLKINRMAFSNNLAYCIRPATAHIEAGDSMTFQVSFFPQQVKDYPDRLMISKNSRFGDSVLVLHGRGVQKPIICLSDTAHDFGQVAIGDSLRWCLTVKNKGNLPLDSMALSVNQDMIFPVKPKSGSISAKDSLEVCIVFKPKACQLYSDMLYIASNDPQKRLLKVPIQGQGIDAKPPTLVHAPPGCLATYQQPVALSIIAEDNLPGVPICTLYYRQGGEAASDYKAMDCTGQDSILLPAETVTPRGIDYYFSAKDMCGNASRAPANPNTHFSLSVALEDSVLARTDSTSVPVRQPIGDAQNAYRMFSIPLVLKNPEPETVFKNYLGPYDMGMTWRLFDYYNGSYYESGENGFRNFEPGRAFWLIVNKPHAPIKVGAGSTVRTSDDADAVCGETRNYRKIKLEPGWNLFGVPYTFPVVLDSLRFTGNAGHLRNQIWIYQGSNGWRSKPGTLWPWEGYAIRSDGVHTMEIRSASPQRESSTSQSVVTKAAGVDGWSIRIEARCDNTADLDNFAGVRPEATDDWDVYDLYEPPPIGDYVAVYFPHQDWAGRSGDFAGDFRTPFPEGAVWEFEVKTNRKNELTTLRFENLAMVPDQFAIYLFDKNHQILTDLRKNGHYIYKELGELLPGRFELIVGTAAFIQGRTTTLQDLPSEFQLHPNYPNPFNNETILSFSLPQAAPVWLKIFDIMGRQVRVLSDGKVWEKGRHYLRWEGSDQVGSKVGSGVYVLSLQAGEFKRQRRIIFIK